MKSLNNEVKFKDDYKEYPGIKRNNLRVLILCLICFSFILYLPFGLSQGKVSKSLVLFLFTYVLSFILIYRVTSAEINYRLGFSFSWGRFGNSVVKSKLYKECIKRELGKTDWLFKVNKLSSIICFINFISILIVLICIAIWPSQLIKTFWKVGTDTTFLR